MLPMLVAIVVCWAVPLLLTLWKKSKRDDVKFALIDAASCALGNGLLAALPLYMAGAAYSSDATDAAVHALIWILFMAVYFPLEGHMNSALTAGAWAAGQVSFAVGAFYIAAQVLGTAIGVELARPFFNASVYDAVGYPTAPFADDGTIAVALAYETACSVAMVLVQLGLCASFDKQYVVASTLVVVLTRYTGAAMDPLGPTSGAIFARDTNDGLYSIHWAGGLVGGAIAGYVWKNVLGRE